MIAIIYVSQTLIDPRHRSRVMDDILTVAIARNTTMGITGLLIASPRHFAQVIEGPKLDVAAVMASISADPRHTAMRIVRQSTVTAPRFPNWRMARFDNENFGNSIVDPLLMAAHAGQDPKAFRRLERLIDIAADPGLAEKYLFRIGEALQSHVRPRTIMQ